MCVTICGALFQSAAKTCNACSLGCGYGSHLDDTPHAAAMSMAPAWEVGRRQGPPTPTSKGAYFRNSPSASVFYVVDGSRVACAAGWCYRWTMVGPYWRGRARPLGATSRSSTIAKVPCPHWRKPPSSTLAGAEAGLPSHEAQAKPAVVAGLLGKVEEPCGHRNVPSRDCGLPQFPTKS